MAKLLGKFPKPKGTISVPVADLDPGEGFIYTLEGDVLFVKGVSRFATTYIPAAADMVQVLTEAVELYGKPGGPWNVPGEPGTWIAKAKEALWKARGEA